MVDDHLVANYLVGSMPPRRTRIFDLVDRLMDGNLAAELLRMRAQEPPETYERIARWLSTEHDVQVTAEAVRQWVRDLPSQPIEAAS